MAGFMRWRSLVPSSDLTMSKIWIQELQNYPRTQFINQKFMFYYKCQTYQHLQKMQSESSIEKKLIKDLINNLKQVSSFGYKIIAQKQFDQLSNWYSELHGKKIVIPYQNTKFFAEQIVMYTYFILGLSKAGDKILTFDTLNVKISKTASSLGRQWLKMQLIGQIKQNEVQIQEKVKKCEIFIFGNPDICSGQYVPENRINMIMKMCIRHQKIIIVDQTQAQLVPNPTTFLGFQYDKFIVIRKISALAERMIRPKYLAVYGGKQISQMRYAASKSLKILPSQLTLQLIETSTSQRSKQEYKRIQSIIRQNINTVLNVLPSQWNPYKEWNKMGRYYLVDKNKMKQLKQLPFKFKQICISGHRQSSFIVLDLTQQCQVFKKNVDQLFSYPKL